MIYPCSRAACNLFMLTRAYDLSTLTRGICRFKFQIIPITTFNRIKVRTITTYHGSARIAHIFLVCMWIREKSIRIEKLTGFLWHSAYMPCLNLWQDLSHWMLKVLALRKLILISGVVILTSHIYTLQLYILVSSRSI